MNDFETALEQYITLASTKRNAWLKEYCPNVYSDTPYVFTAERGSKYVKIVMTSGQSSVHSFVEIGTGNVYKAASWRAPAKNAARGNIFFDDGADALTVDGFIRGI